MAAALKGAPVRAPLAVAAHLVRSAAASSAEELALTGGTRTHGTIPSKELAPISTARGLSAPAAHCCAM